MQHLWNRWDLSGSLGLSGLVKADSVFTNIAANIGRLGEPNHVIYIRVNHMEIRRCVVRSAYCGILLCLFYRECQISRQSFSVAQDTYAYLYKRTWSHVAQTTSWYVLSDRISNKSSMRLTVLVSCNDISFFVYSKSFSESQKWPQNHQESSKLSTVEFYCWQQNPRSHNSANTTIITSNWSFLFYSILELSFCDIRDGCWYQVWAQPLSPYPVAKD